jgi:hypothetical protein
LSLKAWWLLVPVLCAGLIGAGVSVGNRAADPDFLFRQRASVRVEPRQVEALVAKAPEPLGRPASVERRRAIRAACQGAGRGQLRNPWRCTVRYGTGDVQKYSVRINVDGSLNGRNADGTGIVQGCCVPVTRR